MTQIAHVKKSAEDYMPWAGAFPHPVYDIEVFNRKPGWYQREMLFIQECVKEGRKFTLADLEQFKLADKPKPVKWVIPADMTLEALLNHKKSNPAEIGVPLRSHITHAQVVEHCTALGAGIHLRSLKPLQGLFAYIWWMAAFRKQQVPHVPITAEWELGDGLYELTGRQFPKDEDYEVLNEQVTMLLRGLA